MKPDYKKTLLQLLYNISGLNVRRALAQLAMEFPGQVTFSSSFSMEDQVISYEILSAGLPITIFTLDTGRLFEETYSVWSRTNEKYNTQIKGFFPDREALETFIDMKGPNSFYESVENRKACCYIRKVEPLKRALKGNSVWITGLRAEHSTDRKDLQPFEWDEGNQLFKYHPLLHWTTQEVKEYIHDNSIPFNSLQEKGFVSIGCSPCTRAIKTGEDFRAGRWWWEDNNQKECGLHTQVNKQSDHSVEERDTFINDKTINRQ